MTTEFLNLVAQMYPKPPKARVQPFRLKLDKRSTANRLAMRRKRAEWHAQGLNSHGNRSMEMPSLETRSILS